jgi:hypothetical protein
MAQWSLYVDESGRFVASQSSVVGGLLVPARADELSVAPAHQPEKCALRRRFREIWGPAPFPPHAALYNDPVGQVLLAGIRITDATKPKDRANMMPDGRHKGARRAAARPALSLLEQTVFAGRLATLSDGTAPWLTHDDVRDARAALWSAGVSAEVWGALDDVLSKQRYEMHSLVRRALERVPGARVVLVRSVEHDGDGIGEPIEGTQLIRDRYVEALELLIERALRVLAPGDSLDLHVLTRNVDFVFGAGLVGGAGSLGTPVRGSLGAQVLRGLVEAVQARIGTAVRISVGSARLFRDTMELNAPLHPFLVFADWVATTFRPVLLNRRSTLAEVERQLESTCVPFGAARAPILSPSLGVLPLTAASGPAALRIAASLNGQRFLPPAPTRPTWVVEQCAAWVGAKGGAA